MGVIIYNGISTADYDITVEQPPSYLGAKRDQEFKHIPGRNGDLIFDKGGYNNVNREYNIAIGSEVKDFSLLSKLVSRWAYSSKGYARLEDSYEPDYFRLAAFDSELNLENVLNHMGRSTIQFNCKPQRFLKSGEVPLMFDGGLVAQKILNPTTQESRPLFEFVFNTVDTSKNLKVEVIAYKSDIPGSPDGRSTRYDVTIDVPSTEINRAGTMTLDCESMCAYYVDGMGIKTNLNPYVAFVPDYDDMPKDFMRFYPGEVSISVYAWQYYPQTPNLREVIDVDEIKIKPRWWTV